MGRYHRDMTRVEVLAALTGWHEIVAGHDCYDAEIRIEALLHSSAELARQLGDADARIAVLTRLYTLALAEIERLRRELRESRPRTPVERAVDVLNKIYEGGQK